MHPMTHVWFPTHFASLEHVLVVQIWIMHYIKCLQNLINIYNGQTNPEQFQFSAWHSCYSMLPVENKVQGEKRQQLSFHPQEGHVSLPEPRGLRQAPVCIASPKLDNYMYHIVTPCQVSWFPGEFWIYRDLKPRFAMFVAKPGWRDGWIRSHSFHGT